MKKLGQNIFIVIVMLFIMAGTVWAKDVKVDVVVVGAGSAGLTAALTAAQGGATVALFEKMPSTGMATSNFAEGIFGAESRFQKLHLSGPTRDEAFKHAMHFNHWKGNPDLIRTLINKSAETIDWLIDQGVEFEPFAPVQIIPKAPNTWHIIKGHGHGLMVALTKKATENKNITIYYNTPVTKLITNSTGNVVGAVAADKKGNTINASAKAVIIATAGFGNNPEWMKKYTGQGDNVIPVGQVKKTGDGIRMAMEVGAETINMESIEYLGIAGIGIDVFSPITATLWQPENVWINTYGKRFCDEATIAWEWNFSGNIINQQKGGIMYVVYDDAAVKRFIEKGITQGIGVIVPPTTKLVGYDKVLRDAVAQGLIKEASSIGELAQKINVDKSTLVSTIQGYNDFCMKNVDDSYAKDRQYLKALNGPKYYAIPVKPAHIGNLGGIKINEKTEVISKDWNTILGLYAAGTCTGGWEGDTYDLTTTGGSFGFSVYMGRIAGENALKYIK